MEALEIGLLHKAFVSQSKALLFFLPPLLLLMLAFLHSETIMPTIWHAFGGFFERPAFAFLLLNFLIVTIIASTKLESHEKGEHEEASKRESIGDGKGAFIAENVIRRGIIGQSHNSTITNGYDYHMNDLKEKKLICINQDLAAAAARAPPAGGATYGRSPPAAAAAAANTLRGAQAAPPIPPSDVPAAAIEKHDDADDHELDSELEELNRRAEEFIARFNHQMRLQHQESLQRKGRHRPCNHHIQYSNHLQLPPPGLLVG